MPLPDEQIRENLAVSIEIVLMRRGGPEFQTVLAKLNQINLEIRDCYDKPKELSKILKEVYGNDFKSIVDEIGWELDEQTKDEKIKGFLDLLK